MAIDWSKLKLAKPGPKARSTTATRRHRRERTAKRKRQAEVIAAVRAEIWRLDQTCALCGKWFHPYDDGEMHEIVPRSKTRGWPPEDRFNRRNCIRLHRECHEAVTGTIGRERARMEFVVPAFGVDGGVMVGYGGQQWWIYRRITMSETTTKPTQATVKKPMRPGTKKLASK